MIPAKLEAAVLVYDMHLRVCTHSVNTLSLIMPPPSGEHAR